MFIIYYNIIYRWSSNVGVPLHIIIVYYYTMYNYTMYNYTMYMLYTRVALLPPHPKSFLWQNFNLNYFAPIQCFHTSSGEICHEKFLEFTQKTYLGHISNYCVVERYNVNKKYHDNSYNLIF